MLADRSTFFEAAFSGRWTDSTESKPIELIDDQPETFNVYLRCAYQGLCKVEWFKAERFLPLFELYILADKLGDLQACNSVVKEIMRYSDEIRDIPGIDAVKLCFGQTPESSPLRRLIVDYYLYEAGDQAIQEDSEKFPNAFLIAVLLEYRRLKQDNGNNTVCTIFSKTVSDAAAYHYHQHNDAFPKCV